MSLWNANEGKDYVINSIDTKDEELNSFLFSLGCYSGESIRIIFRLKKSCVISIKGTRYSIDKQLAESILI